MKIYTRTGDDGTTGLFYGGRVPKTDPRPVAYGDVDELQALLGVVRAASAHGDDLAEIVLGVQRDLWVLMAELATGDENQHKLVDGQTRVTSAMVTSLEGLIDTVSERFDPPTEFVVPGGTAIGSQLDVARTVARRAERVALGVPIDGSHVVPYLNRVSDLLWTLARWQDGESLRVRDL